MNFWNLILWGSKPRTVHFLCPNLHYDQVWVNQLQVTVIHHFNHWKRFDRLEQRRDRRWRSLGLLKIAESVCVCVSVPPKLCTYAESDWFKGGRREGAFWWGRAEATACYLLGRRWCENEKAAVGELVASTTATWAPPALVKKHNRHWLAVAIGMNHISGNSLNWSLIGGCVLLVTLW